MNRKPKPSPFGPASHASMAVIACLAAAGAATYEPLPTPRKTDSVAIERSIKIAVAEQQGDLAMLRPIPKERAMPKDRTRQLARKAAKAEGVDPATMHGLLRTENAGRLTADISSKGACGASQLMPATARELGVDCANPEQNVRGGAKYLGRMTRRFGSPTLGLIAYNWGPGNTERWLKRGGEWSRLPKETRDYVSKVNVNAALSNREIQLADNQ